MKVFLMYKERDFDVQQELPWNEPELTQDLELDTLFIAMARGDYFLQDAAKKVIFSGLNDRQDSILYRQSILKDCLKNPVIVRNLYNIAADAMETKQKNHWGWLLENSNPAYVMSVSVGALQMFVGSLKQLRAMADEHADKFESEGFKTLFAMIKKELDAPYFAVIQNHLRRLEFHHGILIGVELGKGNEGTNYILRKPLDKKQNLMQRIFTKKSPVYTFRIETRDEGGSKALEELRNKGIKSAVNSVAQSADHIDSFFNMLRFELGFYIGCLNLHEQLVKIGEPVSFPEPAAVDERQHAFSGLYDICLALTMKKKVVSNEVNADKKDLVVITGANQGGKSTFLRSIGLAQMMMQCGMFTPAETFRANVCDGLFTHFKREEDITMESGKLDEELKRTSEIVDRLTLNSLVLFNESFAATNEREGSEIARQITTGLVEKGIKVFFVTHQYEFAHGLYNKKMENSIFLRADREADGTRTYKLTAGEPLQTSYGEDLYNRIFINEKS
ncbi:MAG: MutS-related protein [Dehalococcoidales bacterium]